MGTYALFNQGAHYLPDHAYRACLARIVDAVRQWQDYCKLRKKQCLLIWRTTVPGHPGCEGNRHMYPKVNFTHWTVPFAEEWLFQRGYNETYHWDNFQHQNMIALDVLQKSGIDFVVMDLYRINILRPDGHASVGKNDCLHNCLGSKTDVQSQLLLHIIKLHKHGLLKNHTKYSSIASSFH